MAPPAFSDLGKQARDIFNKNYNFNYVKLECRTKTAGGMDFTVNGSSNTETGKITSSLESKYKVPEYGLTLKEKWSTDNVLSTEVEVNNKPVKGLKLALDGTLVPVTGKVSACMRNSLKLDNISLNMDVDIDPKAPVVHTAAVMGLRGWLVGARASFNACKGNLLKNTFAVGYSTDDFVLHTNVNDGQEFGGAVYQKVNPNLETGVQVAWASGNNATSFGLGCVYTIDNDTSLRAKINNSSQLGLGITHRIREGIQFTLSAMIDGRSFNQGGHKLGLGLDLEA